MKILFNTSAAFWLPAILILAACSKSSDGPKPAPVPPPVQFDTTLTRLKQIEISNLPSPYYHFTYNDSGYATHIDFASGFFRYDVTYNNRRISKLTNNVNGDWLQYQYQNGKVIAIDEFSGITGTALQRYEFSYDFMQRLVHVEWFIITGNNEKILDKKADLKYTNDSNLSEYSYSIRMDDGTIQWISTTTYGNYDNKKNVDDFGLIKQFFEHLLYLPGVRLQMNNPMSGTMISAANTYEINYQYQYSQDRPISKISKIRQTRGANAGREVTSNTTYTYY